MNPLERNKLCNFIRKEVLTMVYSAKEGHIGSSFSCVEAIVTLYFDIMNIDPKNPEWDKRDRFVLSKGHAAPVLYSVLALKGFFPISYLNEFRKYNSFLQGHPEMNNTPGIDISTGSLGNGMACSIGMAINAKMKNFSYNVFVLVGDGELQEGIIWEAAMIAAQNNLDNLILLIDNNKMQLSGKTESIVSLGSLKDKWTAFGWDYQEVNGHDCHEILKNLNMLRNAKNGKPKVLALNTIKGKGVDFMEDNAEWHGKIPSDLEYIRAMEILKNERT